MATTKKATKKKATKRTAKKRKARTVEHEGRLEDLVAAYLAHLEHEGRSAGTLFSVGIELRSACAELGADTLLADFTAEKVLAYYSCDRVTKTRSGMQKSLAGIAKTRRCLRMALEWGRERGIVSIGQVAE